MKQNKNNILFVCMAHDMLPSQIEGFDIVFGKTEYITLEQALCGHCTNYLCKQGLCKDSQASSLVKSIRAVDPEWNSDKIKAIAFNLVQVAVKNKATHILIAGEPTLVYYATRQAILSQITVVQSTTRRDTISEITMPDGSVKKLQEFRHVMWRILN